MRTFLALLMLGSAFCSINAYAAEQAGAVTAQTTETKVLAVENFDGLSEEQILALLKQMTIDDILRCLQKVIASGRMTTIGNYLGALNTYLATSGMTQEQVSGVVERILQENPTLGAGYAKGGKLVVFINSVNTTINSMIRQNAGVTRDSGGSSNFNPTTSSSVAEADSKADTEAEDYKPVSQGGSK